MVRGGARARRALPARTSARSSPPRASPRTWPTWRSWRARSRRRPSRGPRRRACGSSSPRPAGASACAQDWWVDERSDPEKSTRAAAQYLKELYEMFGDWNLALAGYNAGEGQVSRGIDRYGRAGLLGAAPRRSDLPRGDPNYVPDDPRRDRGGQGAGEVRLRGRRPSRRSPYDTRPRRGRRRPARGRGVRGHGRSTSVQLLNPELRRLATPANRTFDVKVPEGRGARARGLPGRLPAGEARHLPDPHRRPRADPGLDRAALRHAGRRTSPHANGLPPRASAWPGARS